jgi:hypothetical protein
MFPKACWPSTSRTRGKAVVIFPCCNVTQQCTSLHMHVLRSLHCFTAQSHPTAHLRLVAWCQGVAAAAAAAAASAGWESDVPAGCSWQPRHPCPRGETGSDSPGSRATACQPDNIISPTGSLVVHQESSGSEGRCCWGGPGALLPGNTPAERKPRRVPF